MARKTKRTSQSLEDSLENGIELAGTVFPANTALKPCICGHEPRQHEMLLEETTWAEWYFNCKVCSCHAFRQMDNFAYVKWVHEKKK